MYYLIENRHYGSHYTGIGGWIVKAESIKELSWTWRNECIYADVVQIEENRWKVVDKDNKDYIYFFIEKR